MLLNSTIEIDGVRDLQDRVARLGLKAKDLRRPNSFIGAEMVKRNRERLDRGVDVNGYPLKSNLSKKLGLAPLGGGRGLYGKSIRYSAGANIELYSTFIGARVAYRGDVITPKTRTYLTIPMEARGGAEARGRAGLSLEDNRTGRRALHYKDTFFLRVDGKLFLVQRDKRASGKNAGKLRFLFFLTRRVKYPKNEWLGFSNDDIERVVKPTYAKHLDTFENKS